MLPLAILLPLLQILGVLYTGNAFRIQYVLCSDDQEDFIRSAVAEARSLARAANHALEQPDVVYSESYEQWFGFESRGREIDIIHNNYKSLQILSGRLIRTFAPIHLADIDSGSILYVSLNASSGLCIDEAITFTSHEALPALYSKFSSVLFLCPFFFTLPITTRLLDQPGAGKVVLHEARHINYVAALLHNSTHETTDIAIKHPSNTTISCQSALYCSTLDKSEKYRNVENNIKFAIDAKYNPELTQGNPCFIFEPADRLRIQPRAPEIIDYASSLVTSAFYQARSLQLRQAGSCNQIDTSSYSFSQSNSISHSQSLSVSHSVSLSISYSLSNLDECSTTATSTIPYTYTGTTVNSTYSGTVVNYTYTATPYKEVHVGNYHTKRHTNEPFIGSSSVILSPIPTATSSSEAASNIEATINYNRKINPLLSTVGSTSFQHAITSKTPTTITSTKMCIATLTFPARSLPRAQELGGNSYINSSQLNQLLQQIVLA